MHFYFNSFSVFTRNVFESLSFRSLITIFNISCKTLTFCSFLPEYYIIRTAMSISSVIDDKSSYTDKFSTSMLLSLPVIFAAILLKEIQERNRKAQHQKLNRINKHCHTTQRCSFLVKKYIQIPDERLVFPSVIFVVYMAWA